MTDIHKAVRWVVAATVLLYVAVVVFAGATYVSLCTFRADLQNRVQTSREFLKTHPDGFAGVPRATIEQAIDNQQRTIDSLWLVRCGL